MTIGNEILVQENDTLIPSTIVQVASLELQGNNLGFFLNLGSFNFVFEF